MPALDLPLFGNVVLCAILVSAAYTFAVSLMAGRRPELLAWRRSGGISLVRAMDVCSLALRETTSVFGVCCGRVISTGLAFQI